MDDKLVLIENGKKAGADCGKDWISPDEAKRLEAQCACLRDAVGCVLGLGFGAPLLTGTREILRRSMESDVGQSLLERLERYEALTDELCHALRQWGSSAYDENLIRKAKALKEDKK